MKRRVRFRKIYGCKRSELYFGKGVILVEGIAEEYLVPRLALNLGIDLDFYGILCCNINSTNFKPFIVLLKELDIPYIIFTDGDYFYEIEVEDDGKTKTERVYHELHKKVMRIMDF